MSIMDLIWPLFFPLLALVIAAIHIGIKKTTGAAILEIVLMWQLAAGWGLSLLFGGVGHLLFPDQVAASIGWAAGSPFQREVGMWDAAMGIVGLLCLKFRDGFWIAMIAGAGIFSVSAGIGHVWELVVHGNTAPDNAGTIMYVDIMYPVILVILYIVWRKMAAKTGN